MENKEIDTYENKKSKFGIFKYIIIILLTAVITYFCTINITLNSYLNKSGMTYLSTKLSLIKNKLEDKYIYDLKEDKMIENAISGYVDGIGDEYTKYLTSEEMVSLMESTSGSYVGIGIYMANNTADNTILVIGVIEGSAAESSGIQAGDIIKKVNGIEYKGDKLEEVSNIIKGQEGTDVKITILRNSQELEFSVKRASVKIKSVGYEILEDNIAYIQITSFNEGTADEFKTAYEEVKKQNPKGLIIDLRNNGGGLVSESLAIAETMVDKGKVLLITSNKEHKEQKEISKEDPIINIPVVILTNKNTASASEILAGILRDNCNYKIIGNKTFGKGVIQSIYSFSDGSGLKVTIEEYFTPNHNVINKVGITPDIEINLDQEWENITNIPYEYDLQLQEAIKQF